MDYIKIGTGLKEFSDTFCKDVDCENCPLLIKRDDEIYCPVAVLGRVVALHKTRIIMGDSEKDAYDNVVRFESSDIPESEKRKRVAVVVEMIESLQKLVKEDD